MIACATCGKENEDFFKFCLGCGSEVGPSEAASAAGEKSQDMGATNESDWPLHNTSPEQPGVADPADKGRDAVTVTLDVGDEAYTIADAQAHPDDPEVLEIGKRYPGGLRGALPDPDEVATRIHKALGQGETERQCRICGTAIPLDYAFCAACGAPTVMRARSSQPIAEEREMEPAGTPRGRLVLMREDGTEADSFALDAVITVVGRTVGHVNFPADEFLASRHASFTYRGDRLILRPIESTNGVFRRLVAEAEIACGDTFRIGQELLRYQSREHLLSESQEMDEAGTKRLGSTLPKQVWGRLSQRLGPGFAANAFLLRESTIYLGRSRGHITFPADGYVSASHAALAQRKGRVFLKDLGSSNGTYLRLRDEVELRHGDVLLVGQQLLRVEP